ncbi:MAG: magnesium transporter CorA [Lachnospiraceae bacterium]|nr:magnesium transporter CorA [Lachnospiraceae bacterium]
MYYLIENTLRECTVEECHCGRDQYVAILSPEEWQETRDEFDMGIDLDFNLSESHTTEAKVNYDSITGMLVLPDRRDMSAEYRKIGFAFDEKGIVFIDAGDTAYQIVRNIIETKKWRFPSLERFLYDFLEYVIHEDLSLLEAYDNELDAIDKEIEGNKEPDIERINDIRGYLRDFKAHYAHLIDLSQEFEENENNFFLTNNLRYFKLFTNRVTRLHEMVTSLLDYTMQIRETYKAMLAEKQNRIMTVLTVVTTIFMPLTLLAGWYGMNFRYMPELNSVFGYPVVIVISILIVAVSIIFFKRKKLL